MVYAHLMRTEWLQCRDHEMPWPPPRPSTRGAPQRLPPPPPLMVAKTRLYTVHAAPCAFIRGGAGQKMPWCRAARRTLSSTKSRGHMDTGGATPPPGRVLLRGQWYERNWSIMMYVGGRARAHEVVWCRVRPPECPGPARWAPRISSSSI